MTTADSFLRLGDLTQFEWCPLLAPGPLDRTSPAALSLFFLSLAFHSDFLSVCVASVLEKYGEKKK